MSERAHELYERTFLPFGFTPREFTELLSATDAKWVTFRDGDMVFKQGQPINCVHFVCFRDTRAPSDGRGGRKDRSEAFEILRDRRQDGGAEERADALEVVNRVDHNRGAWAGEPWDPEASWDTERCSAHSCRIVTNGSDRTVHAVRFNAQALHDFIAGNPAVQPAADRLAISDTWGKLHHATRAHYNSNRAHRQQIADMRSQLSARALLAYEAMVQLAISDGVVVPEEAAAVS